MKAVEPQRLSDPDGVFFVERVDDTVVKRVHDSKELYAAVLRREFEMLTALSDCEGVVRGIALEARDGDVCLVMEYGGEDVFRILHTADEVSQRSIVRQTCDAVAALHARGVAHMDIKPENVVCDASGRVRLIDVGYALYIPEKEREARSMRQGIGSLGYAAPELLRRDSFNAFEVDRWSLGVFVFVLWFKFSPWHIATSRDELYATFSQHARDAPVRSALEAHFLVTMKAIPPTPPWVWSALRLMHPDPDARCAISSIEV